MQVDSGTSIQDVKAIIEAETGIPSQQQNLISGGTRLLRDEWVPFIRRVGVPHAQLRSTLICSETVGACSLNDGDMLQLIPQQQMGGQPTQPQQQGPNSHLEMNADGSSKNPAGLISYIRNNPQQMLHLEQSNPPLAK